jgi:hypothetical protein
LRRFQRSNKWAGQFTWGQSFAGIIPDWFQPYDPAVAFSHRHTIRRSHGRSATGGYATQVAGKEI